MKLIKTFVICKGLIFIGGEVMKNYKFGYARVSTEEQVLDRQIDMLSEYGVNQDRQ